MQTTRLGLLISGLLVALSACALAPLEGEGEDMSPDTVASSLELHPGKEEASVTERQPRNAPGDRTLRATDQSIRRAKLIAGPTPDPWEEASSSVDESSGPTPDPWQPAQPDGPDRKGSTPPENSSPNGSSKN